MEKLENVLEEVVKEGVTEIVMEVKQAAAEQGTEQEEAAELLEQEAAEVLEATGEAMEEEQEATSRAPGRPRGSLSDRSYYRYRAKVLEVLARYRLPEQMELVLCLAAAFSLPSLPTPLRAAKLLLHISGSALQQYLSGR
jgi:hypothetical protein